jgi:hypothetical protein
MVKYLYPHKVKPGETLSIIARQFGVDSWSTIYYHKNNFELRKKRPNPNQIRPNDVVLVPVDLPDLRKVLKARLQRLLELQKDLEETHKKQKDEVKKAFSAAVNTGLLVDLGAVLVTGMAGIAKLIKAARPRLAATGTAIAKANEELMKSAMKSRGGFAWPFQFGSYTFQDLAAMTATKATNELTGNDGLVWPVTRIVLESYLDLASPSFWA